jgi:hypothetical protein
VIVWGYLDWGMQTLRSAFIALCGELMFLIQPECSSGYHSEERYLCVQL